MAPLLRVNDLRTSFFTSDGEVRAVDGVTFDIEDGCTVGLVGESGCGKSVTALSIVQLLPKGTGRIVGGRFDFKGLISALPAGKMRSHPRQRDLDDFPGADDVAQPGHDRRRSDAETVRLHHGASRNEARHRAIEMLRLVRIADAPRSGSKNFPHQFSGGQRQRVMIAMALACTPKLLIADEPTTALDVTIQAQILELIGELQQRLGMAVLLITHDLGVVAERADEVAVMYAGKIVESAKPEVIFSQPKHPYTIGLLNSMPGRRGTKKRLEAIPGMVPNPLHWPTGCRFRDAMRARRPRVARSSSPPLIEIEAQHRVACFMAA